MIDDLGPLSERELEVLKLVATGATNQEIARTLIISPNTVKVHLRNIFEKLGVQSRTEATMAAVRLGLVSVPAAEVVEASDAAGETADLVEAVAEPNEDLPFVPTRGLAPLPLWRRAYLVIAALVVGLAILLPGWWRGRSETLRATPFSDLGQPQVAPAPRSPVQRWTARQPLPAGRSRLALVADATRIYAIGGEGAEGVSDEVAIYDPATDAWTAGPRKPTATSNIAGAWLARRIYVPGGTVAGGGVTNVLEAYDPAAAVWEARASLPTPLTAYGLAVLGEKLYLFGGWDGKAYRREVYIYDPVADRWEPGTPMAGPRAFLSASALEGVILVVGGFDGEQELATVEAYDPAAEGSEAGPWSVRSPLNQARGGLATAVIGSRLYAVGGGWLQPLTFNEQYDTTTGAWSRIGTPINGQWRHLGLVAYGQKLYAAGGWSGNYLANVEEYQALLRQLLPLGTKGG